MSCVLTVIDCCPIAFQILGCCAFHPICNHLLLPQRAQHRGIKGSRKTTLGHIVYPKPALARNGSDSLGDVTKSLSKDLFHDFKRELVRKISYLPLLVLKSGRLASGMVSWYFIKLIQVRTWPIGGIMHLSFLADTPVHTLLHRPLRLVLVSMITPFARMLLSPSLPLAGKQSNQLRRFPSAAT